VSGILGWEGVGVVGCGGVRCGVGCREVVWGLCVVE
jgi:hypothetical protein